MPRLPFLRFLLWACLLWACLLLPAPLAWGQDTEQTAARADSSLVQDAIVQDALFERPFIGAMGRTAVGGYLEANTNYFAEDGVSEGFSMEMRRFNLFLFSSISPRVRFLSELEFEHGTEEIALETALIDFRITPALVLRAGILLPPIGAYNQNHDGPLWAFIERPLVATEIIPSTLSEVGFGINGKVFPGRLILSYDVYLTNGLGDGILLNAAGRTYLPAGKREAQFEEDNNGSPALSGRLAASDYRYGEVGVSYYGGVYNTYRIEGEEVDEKRRVRLLALDANATIRGIAFNGEAALAQVDVPASLQEVFAERQWGGYVEAVVPVYRPQRLLGYRAAVVHASLRLERVDFNVGTFSATGRRRYDEVNAVVLGASLRPTPDTVFRANYRYHRSRDLLGNPTVQTAGFQFGFASYF